MPALSRLAVTGPLCKEDTPICVLEEAADAHWIPLEPRETLHRRVLNLVPLRVEIPFPQGEAGLRHRRLVAGYINSRVPLWTLPQLAKAYNFLSRFVSAAARQEALEVIRAENAVSFGPQTPEHPYSLNCCVLYRLCRQAELPLQRSTSLAQMAGAVQCLLGMERSWLLAMADCRAFSPSFYRSLASAVVSNDAIISAAVAREDNRRGAESSPVTSLEVTTEALSLHYSELTDVDRLRRQLSPTDVSGAVALAALVYHVDLSLSGDPMAEYKFMLERGDSWQPTDERLAAAASGGRHIIDLRRTFNPLFPPGYYSTGDLQRIGAEFGCRLDAELYNDLCELYFLDNFYPGRWPGVVNVETPISCDRVADLQPSQLLSYGPRTGPLVAITYEELANFFRASGTFVVPFRNTELFSQQSIQRLKKICQSDYTSDRSAARLQQAITDVEERMWNLNERATSLTHYYNQLSPETQRAIRRALRQLLQLGLTMRGWLGTTEDLERAEVEGQLPISIAQVEERDKPRVEQKVTEEHLVLDDYIRGLGNVGTFLLDLPLLKYQRDFHASMDESEGLTIKQRLELVRQGDMTTNMNSCIRMSSNWICASAYFYMQRVGLRPPFDIARLREIS